MEENFTFEGQKSIPDVRPRIHEGPNEARRDSGGASSLPSAR